MEAPPAFVLYCGHARTRSAPDAAVAKEPVKAVDEVRTSSPTELKYVV